MTSLNASPDEAAETLASIKDLERDAKFGPVPLVDLQTNPRRALFGGFALFATHLLLMVYMRDLGEDSLNLPAWSIFVVLGLWFAVLGAFARSGTQSRKLFAKAPTRHRPVNGRQLRRPDSITNRPAFFIVVVGVALLALSVCLFMWAHISSQPIWVLAVTILVFHIINFSFHNRRYLTSVVTARLSN